MPLHIRFRNLRRQQVYTWLHHAYATGALRLINRIHALLYLTEDPSVAEVASRLGLGEQTIWDDLRRFVLRGLASVVDKLLPGRPSKLTNTQRQELAHLSAAGPQAAGYTSGC